MLPSVMRTAVVPMVVAASLAGCFYVDPINERPGADILRVNPELPSRGSSVEVRAKIVDPDGDVTIPDWRAYACNVDGCDAAPFDTSADEVSFRFTAPYVRQSGSPATYVHVALTVEDSLGAPAMPAQSVDINVDNAPPELEEPQRSGRFFRGAYPVDTTVRLTFAATDGDDGLQGITFASPGLFAPAGATLADAVFERVDDETVVDGEAIYALTASAPGQWDVAVTVSDPLGETDNLSTSVVFAADHPPCLHVADPEFPPAGAQIILDERRRFAVLAIDDDRDVFPPPAPDDDVLGAASFRWWLATPATGGALEPLAVDGNGVTLDPAGWSPGDVLELRVEAVDREDRPLCDASLPSCELVAGCFQRQTWAMEVR